MALGDSTTTIADCNCCNDCCAFCCNPTESVHNSSRILLLLNDVFVNGVNITSYDSVPMKYFGDMQMSSEGNPSWGFYFSDIWIVARIECLHPATNPSLRIIIYCDDGVRPMYPDGLHMGNIVYDVVHQPLTFNCIPFSMTFARIDISVCGKTLSFTPEFIQFEPPISNLTRTLIPGDLELTYLNYPCPTINGQKFTLQYHNNSVHQAALDFMALHADMVNDPWWAVDTPDNFFNLTGITTFIQIGRTATDIDGLSFYGGQGGDMHLTTGSPPFTNRTGSYPNTMNFGGSHGNYCYSTPVAWFLTIASGGFPRQCASYMAPRGHYAIDSAIGVVRSLVSSTPPSLIMKGINFLSASAQHIMTGMKSTDAETKRIRLQQCESCWENFDFYNRTCNVCGCFVDTKASWQEQQCPIGKW